MMSHKITLDKGNNVNGPIYATSLPSAMKSRDLSLIKKKPLANIDSFMSLGLSRPAVVTNKSNGPIHSNSYLKSGGNSKVFHMDRTPISLEGRYPSKAKQEFFDENNADQEKMFSMYNVSDQDFNN